jgi:hypothetical protein
MSTTKLPHETKIIQFERAHATVIFKNELSAATGKRIPRLYVQCIDQYGYQREWSLQRTHKPGDSSTTYWESHIYQHPGRREITEVSDSIAARCIGRFLYLCENYPTLLFNETAIRAQNAPNGTPDVRPRSEGFVHFAEALHRGARPTAKML